MSGEEGEPTRYVVVDASVALKWALDDEEAVAQAMSLRDAALAGQFVMAAPSLWIYEVTNGLVMATRRSRLSADLARTAIGHIMELGVKIADPEVTTIHELAIRHRLTAYDASYVALATALDAELWTGDRRLFEAMRRTRDRDELVRWIGDWPAPSSPRPPV